MLHDLSWLIVSTYWAAGKEKTVCSEGEGRAEGKVNKAKRSSLFLLKITPLFTEILVLIYADKATYIIWRFLQSCYNPSSVFLSILLCLYPSLVCISASPSQLHKCKFFIKCWTALFKVLSKTTVSSKKLELKVTSQNPKYSIYDTYTKRVSHVLI